MPRSPRRGCAYGWCSRLAVDGERYCEEHLKKATKEYERFGRDPKTKRMYGKAWERIRKRYAKAHPFCEECLKAGRMTTTEHIHHIKPLAEGGTHDEENLMALCKSCHSRIHTKGSNSWGRSHEY